MTFFANSKTLNFFNLKINNEFWLNKWKFKSLEQLNIRENQKYRQKNRRKWFRIRYRHFR